MTDTTDKLIIQAETQGVQQSTTELNQLGKSMDGVSVASDKTERSTTSLDGKFQALERRFGTVAGNAAQFAKIQDTVNKAVSQNPALLEQGNAVLEAARIKYGQVADAEKALGAAHAGLDAQGQAALHSIRSIVEQLALGIPPTQALTGQLNHLTFAATGQGGLSGAFSQVTGMLSGMLTPMRLAAGGVAGLAAGALYLANSWSETSDKVNLALTGISQKTGTTATDVANFTKANASATGLSVAQARDAALEFTKTGNVAIANLKGVGEAIHGYALLTGKDATEATKAFSDALSGDLFKGIENLDQRYGSLNSSTLEYIRTLIDSGDKTKALQVFMDSTAAANKRAEESVGTLTKAWQGFKNVVSNIASGPAPTSLQDQLSALQAQRDKAASAPVGQTPGGYFNSAAAFGGKSQELAEFDKQISDLQQKINDFNAQTLTSQQDDISKKAFAATNAILPQIDAIRQLDEAIKNIQKSQADGTAPANADAALAVYQHQADLQQQSLDTMVRQAQVANTLVATYGGVSVQTAITLNNLQLQLNAAQALTGAAQMQAAAQATYTNLVVQGVAAEEAAKIAAAQLAVSQAAATTQVLKQVEALKDSTAMIKAQQNGTEATTAAAIAYKNAINAGADATAAAALKAATLANYIARAAQDAQQLVAAMGASASISIAGSPSTFDKYGVPYLPDNSSSSGPGYTSSFDLPGGGGGFGVIDAAHVNDQGAAFNFTVGGDLLKKELGLTPARTIDTLNTSLQSLTKSTDSLNNTNQELLSPYYAQDPRTSHIGFRSQGMADGGYVDVPGSPSANDNMIATIPVASGERIYVDSMPSKRGGGGSQSIVINLGGITINGGSGATNPNAIGRTVYQALQTGAKQIAAASR